MVPRADCVCFETHASAAGLVRFGAASVGIPTSSLPPSALPSAPPIAEPERFVGPHGGAIALGDQSFIIQAVPDDDFGVAAGQTRSLYLPCATEDACVLEA